MNKHLLVGLVAGLILFGGIFFLLKDTILQRISPSPSAQISQSSEPPLVCKRFTNLDEAADNTEIACVLDLSTTEATPSSLEYNKLSQLDKLVDLSLKGHKLTTIPNEIFSLTGLLSLDLSDNNLKEVPEEISNLTNLQILELSNNSLSESEKEKIQNLLPQTAIEF